MSGKPPASAKPASAATKANAAAIMDSNMTEEEKIQAMLKMTDAKWQVEKEEMSHDTRINFGGPKTKKANVPEGEPPHGYICYRCMTRGKPVPPAMLSAQTNKSRPLDSSMPYQR